jgi:transposase
MERARKWVASVRPVRQADSTSRPESFWEVEPRNLIERFFNKIKQCRSVATRYDKLASDYLAFAKLASIRI